MSTDDGMSAALAASLLEVAQGERRLRAADPVDLYAGVRNGGGGAREEPRPGELVPAPATEMLDMSEDARRLVETGRLHVEQLCAAVYARIEEGRQLFDELESEMRTMSEQRNEADLALVRLAHRAMATVPLVELQARDMMTAVRAARS
jgi:hypothetical protein